MGKSNCCVYQSIGWDGNCTLSDKAGRFPPTTRCLNIDSHDIVQVTREEYISELKCFCVCAHACTWGSSCYYYIITIGTNKDTISVHGNDIIADSEIKECHSYLVRNNFRLHFRVAVWAGNIKVPKSPIEVWKRICVVNAYDPTAVHALTRRHLAIYLASYSVNTSEFWCVCAWRTPCNGGAARLVASYVSLPITYWCALHKQAAFYSTCANAWRAPSTVQSSTSSRTLVLKIFRGPRVNFLARVSVTLSSCRRMKGVPS